MKSLGLAPKAALALVCFAGNSLLCRAALRVSPPLIDAASFSKVRIASGAIILALLVMLQKRPMRDAWTWVGGLSLTGYVVAFTFAYLKLDAGIGALILFGMVQVSMLGYARFRGTKLTVRQTVGLLAALGGLLLLTAPGKDAPDLASAAMMAFAGLAWGAYTLNGKRAKDPLAASAANFMMCLPVVQIINLLLNDQSVLTAEGIALAAVSGAVTSGLGYAVWYAVVPRLGTQRAAMLQLTVPGIALLGIVGVLGEALSPRAAVAALVILAGVGTAVIAPRPPVNVAR